jgi:hypothetical protein
MDTAYMIQFFHFISMHLYIGLAFMHGYMKNKMELYTSWNSTVGWGWGIISTIKAFREQPRFSFKSIKNWLYE